MTFADIAFLMQRTFSQTKTAKFLSALEHIYILCARSTFLIKKKKEHSDMYNLKGPWGNCVTQLLMWVESNKSTIWGRKVHNEVEIQISNVKYHSVISWLSATSALSKMYQIKNFFTSPKSQDNNIRVK